MNIADWSLLWPRQVFRDELLAVQGREDADMELLLEEAFDSDLPLQAFKAAGRTFATLTFLLPLQKAIDHIPERSGPPPLFSQRRSGLPPAVISFGATTLEFVRLIESWNEAGYFELDMPKGCVDNRNSVTVHPNHALEVATGRAGYWPLSGSRSSWTEDDLLDLVEVFGHMAARPRHRTWHDWDQCGWHTSHHSRTTGRRIYTHVVNQLLDRSHVRYRIATSGEDAGFVVARVPEPLGALADTVASRTAGPTADERRHAIRLFRARGATRQDKRSAVVALAHVLEERRDLVKDELLSKDEGALFSIANQFAIRHQRADQRPDYDDVYLDWLFWWYLATLELTDALAAR